MTLSKISRVTAIGVAMMMLLAACDSQAAELTTTSALVTDGISSPSESTTTSVAANVTTAPTLVGSRVEGYEVVARVPGDLGEILYIVIPQAAYTDIDLENFVGNLVENGIVTWGAEIFDDVLAAEAYQKAEVDRTEDEAELISTHHFASVVNGDTLRFQGPFESSGEFIIAS